MALKTFGSSNGWLGLSWGPIPWLVSSHQRPQDMCSGARHSGSSHSSSALTEESSHLYHLLPTRLGPLHDLHFCPAFLLRMLQLHWPLAGILTCCGKP